MKKILIAAGGTGGHISPGVSIAQAFAQLSHEVVFLTMNKNLDYPDIVKLSKQGIQVVGYEAPRLPSSIKSAIKFFLALMKCNRLLKSIALDADAIIGLGGYPSFPAVNFAKNRKIPYFLCEQNAQFGQITRWMGKKAKRVFLSFPKKQYKPNEILVGNPLRPFFLEQKKIKQNRSKIKHVLMLGGSQGAKNMNDLYLECIHDNTLKKLNYTLSVGPKSEVEMLAKLKNAGRKNDVVTGFIQDLPSALQKADLIISRSGSSSIFEILWAKKYAVFLPYPHAANDHQLANAEAITSRGLASMIDIRPFDAPKALSELKAIIEKFNNISLDFSKFDFALSAHEKITEHILNDIS